MRELDALVAEKVMGWRIEHAPPLDKNDVWVTRLYRGSEEATHLSGKRTIHDLIFAVPHYSTDIAAAWQVVEKLRLFSICEMRQGYFADPDAYSIYLPAGIESIQWCVTGATAPLAICLAALKAVGE